jgi:GH35 family endo-1,4-beta-xylanase
MRHGIGDSLGRFAPAATLTTVFALACGLARAELPEAYRKLWDDPALVKQIDDSTERCRKADAVVEVVDAQGNPVRDAKVKAEQRTHEFLFGCNLFVLGQLDTPELNRKYEEAFARLFNFATLPFYWGDLERQQGKPRFAEGSAHIWRRPPPDRLVAWCKAHGVTPKGHALMYAKNMFMPDWTARNDPKAFLEQARKHIAEITERYGRDVAVWDVVNEEIPRLASPGQWHAVPDDYLPWCFEEAGRLVPKNAKLLLNDGTSQAHVTTAQYETLLKGLLARGLRLEGIGIQFHVSRDGLLSGKQYPPAQLTAVYERLGQLGLPLYITEITVPGTGERGPELQAAVVANLYRLWFSTPRMAGVTWWNLGDGTAYRDENKALGGLLDKDMNPKPAYQALDKLINHDWKTQTAGTTGADGRFAFRGFKGRYLVTVESPAGSQEFQIDVTSEAGKTHKLVLAKPKN